MFLRRPYETVGEFYKAAEVLARELEADGHAAEAARIDGLLNGVWTTSSELIGELMLSLSAMKGSYPGHIRKRMDDCLYFARHHRRILGLK